MFSSRRARGIFYIPTQNRFFLIFTVILSIVMYLLFINVVGYAFKTLFPSMGTMGVLLILTTCLLGSYVNIPIKRYTTTQPQIRIKRVRVFGITYPIPDMRRRVSESLLAINVGGALVPTVTSLYLLTKVPSTLYTSIIASISIVAIVVRLLSKPVQGMGIIVPILVPPFMSALTGVLFGGDYSHVLAYVAGTIGTLLGADILNLHQIKRLGAPVISIGGAGTFDGVFLAGIIGVLIA